MTTYHEIHGWKAFMYKFTKKIVNSRKHSGSFAYYTTSLEQNFKGVTTTMQMAVVTVIELLTYAL